MKKRIVYILICCLGMLFALQCKAETLELVTLQYPPYEYEENGRVQGMVVDLVKEVFHRMEQPINITLLPWARALQMIERGEADAIFTAYKNPEREKFADYSKEILMPQIVSLFVLNDSPVLFDGDLSKLNSYSIGARRKVSYGTIFDDAVKDKILSAPILANTGKQNVKKLLKKRIDILVSNKYGALYILKQLGKMNQVRELLPELQRVPSYIAFSKKRNRVSIRDRFDDILSEMKTDGTYDKIIADFLK